MTGEDDVSRDVLLRRLRASAVVNAQLHAQLRNATPAPSGNGTTALPAPKVRRGGVGDDWLEDLLDAGAGDPRLVTSQGAIWLVEGDLRRPVRAGQIIDLLVAELGDPAEVESEAVQRWEAMVEGPPVEVMEAPSGAPFIVVAGTRHDLRGVLVTYPVAEHLAAGLPVGKELRLGVRAAQPEVEVRPHQPTTSLRRQLRRVRRVARRILGRISGAPRS